MFKSFLNKCRFTGITACNDILGTTMQKAGIKYFPIPTKYDIEIPPDSRGKKLPPIPKQPIYPNNVRPFKMQKRLRYMRGPEELHNTLLHKQYGIIASIGGRLEFKHFEMIRTAFNKKLTDRAFAIWRVDPPWQPVTKKSQGMRMGGGKGAIDKYVTPIKAGRVILEVGGPIEWEEIKVVMEDVAKKLPFKAIAVSQTYLDQKQEQEKYIEENNKNPYTLKYVIQNNLGGCHNWIRPADKLWFGKHQ